MIDFAIIQRRLQQKHLYDGRIDGIAGPKTYAGVFSYMADRDLGDRGKELGAAAAEFFPQFDIDETKLRLAHFLAQSSHESGKFRYMREIWGPTSAQKHYEGRGDLGNVIPGDGFRFLGRGIFQCTGRDNYDRYGKRIGLDLCCNPQLVEQPRIGLWIACLYWTDHRLNAVADADNILGTSNGINRGNSASLREPNGFADRKHELAKAKGLIL